MLFLSYMLHIMCIHCRCSTVQVFKALKVKWSSLILLSSYLEPLWTLSCLEMTSQEVTNISSYINFLFFFVKPGLYLYFHIKGAPLSSLPVVPPFFILLPVFKNYSSIFFNYLYLPRPLGLISVRLCLVVVLCRARTGSKCIRLLRSCPAQARYHFFSGSSVVIPLSLWCLLSGVQKQRCLKRNTWVWREDVWKGAHNVYLFSTALRCHRSMFNVIQLRIPKCWSEKMLNF